MTADTSQVASNGILTVKTNFSSATDLTPSPANGLCQPHTFCCPSSDSATCTSSVSTATSCIGALKSTDPLVVANPKMKAEADTICKAWGMKDLDCPAGGCYGFTFTLNGYTADSTYHRPAPVAFPEANSDPSNPQGAPNWTTKFSNTATLPDSGAGAASAPIRPCRIAPSRRTHQRAHAKARLRKSARLFFAVRKGNAVGAPSRTAIPQVPRLGLAPSGVLWV